MKNNNTLFGKLQNISILIFCIFTFTSCGKLIFREIVCRDIEFDFEEYMFSENINENVSFINEQSNEIKKFNIVDKSIEFTEKYYSDTGCGCNNQSGVLAINGQDSIWITQSSSYIEKNNTKNKENIVWEDNGKQSSFYETHIQKDSIFEYKSISFKNVKVYKKQETDPLKIKTLVLQKDLGILYLEQVNGQIWINSNNILSKTKLEDFTITKSVCN